VLSAVRAALGHTLDYYNLPLIPEKISDLLASTSRAQTQEGLRFNAIDSKEGT